MKDLLEPFNKKYKTNFRKVKGSPDELYSDGLLYLRFEDRVTINILKYQIAKKCEEMGEDYCLLEDGDLDGVSYMLYT